MKSKIPHTSCDLVLIKNALSSEEKEFLKAMRKIAGKDDTIMSDKFPYSIDMVLSLAQRGILDLVTSHEGYAMYLTILLPDKLKGIHL